MWEQNHDVGIRAFPEGLAGGLRTSGKSHTYVPVRPLLAHLQRHPSHVVALTSQVLSFHKIKLQSDKASFLRAWGVVQAG